MRFFDIMFKDRNDILLLESACPFVTKFATHQFLPPPDHYLMVVVVVVMVV